jgi:AraC-like DNA-binding protein
MKAFHPLLLTKLDIRIPGWHVRQLELHRHLTETASVKPHTHRHAQCLCYLSGEGWQEIAGERHRVRPGTVVTLPRKREHAFRRDHPRRPICLVIDFDGEMTREPEVRMLPAAALRELRQTLSRLTHLVPSEGTVLRPLAASLLLHLLDLLLVTEEVSVVAHRTLVQRLLHLIHADTTRAPQELARLVGYQQDHLNRLLRESIGLTLGQLRHRELLKMAKEKLKGANSIAELAMTLGFDDPNYFARWFRLQTGVSPSRWQNKD